MRVFCLLFTAAATWWPTRRPGGDRGDNPIPSAIIIGGLALLALALLTWGWQLATDWMNQAPGPGELPEAPGNNGGGGG
jgi:hypothetical protein